MMPTVGTAVINTTVNEFTGAEAADVAGGPLGWCRTRLHPKTVNPFSGRPTSPHGDEVKSHGFQDPENTEVSADPKGHERKGSERVRDSATARGTSPRVMATTRTPRGTSVTSSGISDETCRSPKCGTPEGDDVPATLSWQALRDLAVAVSAITKRLGLPDPNKVAERAAGVGPRSGATGPTGGADPEVGD